MKRDPTATRIGYTSVSYIQALEEGLLPIWPEEGGQFQQDNAPIHTAGRTTSWLENHTISYITWPPHSPDLNPIEHVWKAMKELLHKRYPNLYLLSLSEVNQAYLEACLKEVWSEVPQEAIASLINSLPRRLQAVIAAKGWYTKY
jgi:transposase